MQGYRIHMEDSHTHILSLPDDPGTSFFAVYDGHGGANIGKYASKHLHKFITKRPEYQTDVSTAMKLVSDQTSLKTKFLLNFLRFVRFCGCRLSWISTKRCSMLRI